MKTKKKTIKGRLAFACPDSWVTTSWKRSLDAIPVLVLPLDDLDGLVEQAAESVNKGYVAPYRYAAARAVLSSLGVRFPKQRKVKS